MLKENNDARQSVNADRWHSAGYTGKGVTIVLLDGDGKPRNHMRQYYTDVLGTETEYGHATNVGHVAHEFAPDARILMFDNKRNKDAVFEWISEHRAEIDLINVSLAGIHGMPTPDYLRYESLGIPIVCASGNDDFSDRISYPARYDFTIAIGAYSLGLGNVAYYSNEGEKLDAVSLTNIHVQRDDGHTWSVSGTSFAAPSATGLLACYVQWRKDNGLPKLTPEEARKFIHENCTDINEEGRDDKSGYGLFCLPKFIPKVVAEVTKEFKDVPADHWAHSAIQEAVKTGLFGGVADDLFAPNEGLTRAQAAVVAVRQSQQLRAYVDAKIKEAVRDGLNESGSR